VIRVSHVTLPAGLSAFARQGPDGNLEVFVSRALPPDRQRAAVRVALRASRRAGWRGALVPLPVAVALAGWRGWVGRASYVLRLHPVAAAATATATIAVTGAAVAVVALPQHGHVSAGQLPAPAAVAPRQGSASGSSTGSPRTHQRGQAAGTHPTTGTHEQGESAASGHSTTPATGHATTPAPGPSESTSPVTTQASPSPQPSPTASHNGDTCITVLGVTVCL